MEDIQSKGSDYQIAFRVMCRDILKAISDFKAATGEESVNIETYDFEYDEELNEATGKFVKPGRKLGINVYIGKYGEDDSGDDE